MTIEEAQEYWSERLEFAAGYSDEPWDAEEHKEYIEYVDALKHAIAALAICRELEEASKKSKTNGDRIRNMTDEELRRFLNSIADNCSMQDCKGCPLNGACDDVPISMQKWLKQGVSQMTNGDKIRAMPDEELAESLSGHFPCRYVTSCLDTSCYECTLRWLKQDIDANDECCDCPLNDITDVQTRLE